MHLRTSTGPQGSSPIQVLLKCFKTKICFAREWLPFNLNPIKQNHEKTMELCWNKEGPTSPSALGSWFSFSSVISHELLTFGLFCKDYLPSVLQSFRPSVTSGQQTCFLEDRFPVDHAIFLQGRLGHLPCFRGVMLSPNGTGAVRLPVVSQLQKVILEYMIWLVPQVCLAGLHLDDHGRQSSTLCLWPTAVMPQKVLPCRSHDFFFLSSFDMVLIKRYNINKRVSSLPWCLPGTLQLRVTHPNIYNKPFSQRCMF